MPWLRGDRVLARAASISLLLLTAGCGTAPDLAAVDLTEPGWQVWSGQASWQRDKEAEPLVGDAILAEGDDHKVFVNLSKSPLNLLTAQSDGRGWHIVFPGGERGGRGKPPRQLVWFHIPALLADEDMEIPGWCIDRSTTGEVNVVNTKTGEGVRLILDSPP